RFKTYDKLLKELKLIASEAEWKQLQDVPAKERQHLVDKFWEKRDPTPETVKNELMTEFYSRVFLAETYFWQGNDEKGWFTDQGKVY
ncbi:MAG: GWxTD domain-containing protein, partial [Aliifodinibius sp.]|nr:GWxTD domain-containing protein [Fodinibius sp.]